MRQYTCLKGQAKREHFPEKKKNMVKSKSKKQKITEKIIRETLENHICGFQDLYKTFYPKHFWQNRSTSWQKECDDFFKSFEKERNYFRENYKALFFKAAENETAKKQLSKNFLKNKDDLLFERKVFICDARIITIYYTVYKNKTIGIAQILNFNEIQNWYNLEWDRRELLQPSSSTSCFCISNEKFRNF